MSGSTNAPAINPDETVLDFGVTVERDGFSLNAAAKFGSGITAVFGPSGAGKSTLLGAIAGSVKPTSGEISLRGRNLFSSGVGNNLRPEKRRIGFVYQDAALFPHMTVEKNILFGYRLTPEEQQRIEPAELYDLLAIAHLKQRKPTELSGGEKQRVALARALATSPDLLLLDEPLSALDLRLRGVVIGYLKAVHERLSIPIVYVSHSISEVIALTDSVLILNNGKVTAFGETRKLMTQAATQGSESSEFAVDNLLEGQVVEARTDGTAGKVRVNGLELVAPTGQRQFGENVVLAVGSREVIIATERPSGISARNIIPGDVLSIDGEGPRRLVTVNCGPEVLAELTVAAIGELALEAGKSVYLVIKSSSISVMDAFQP